MSNTYTVEIPAKQREEHMLFGYLTPETRDLAYDFYQTLKLEKNEDLQRIKESVAPKGISDLFKYIKSTKRVAKTAAIRQILDEREFEEDYLI